MVICMNIPVVFATDENYLFYTVVAITSMAENAGDRTFYQIYVLVSASLGKGHRLLADLQEKYDNIEICLLQVREDEFQNVHINSVHVTKATFYRLSLCELLSVDKCLYLDSDVIVTTDLQELYLTRMGDNYIAGVRDLWIDLMKEEKREERRRKIGIPSLEQYVNAGVLLFNLEQIRKDGLAEQFRTHMKNNYPHEDQDILNVCCYGRIMRLPAKWNLFTLFMGRLDELEQNGIHRDTICYMNERKGIIHYATPYIRPWESERFLCNDIWWKYAAIWEKKTEYQELWENMRMREIGCSEKRMADYCARYEKAYIWGFTELGRKVFDGLVQRGIENIAGFIDNDDEKQKLTYCGKPVIFFDREIYDAGKIVFIIVSQKSGKEIQDILTAQKVRKEDIISYVKKGCYYYQCLRPEFQKEEQEGKGAWI